jgi:lysophospholipase L1-like esterase
MATTGRHRIGLILAATAFAAIMCEVAARIAFAAPPNEARQPQIAYQYDPEIRYLLLPNQRGWIDDGFATTNALGFRGATPTLPKPSGLVRIVAVGDSVTFGFGVNDEDTFCVQAERLLRSRHPAPNLEIVNLAVPGYDTRQEVTLLGRHIARLNPDIVLVGFYSNDVPDSLEDNQSGTTVTKPAAQGEALHMNAAPTSWWDIQMRKSRAIYTVGRALRRFTHSGEWGMARYNLELDILQGHDTPQLEAAWQRVAKQLDVLHQMAKSSGFSVGIVVLPPKEQVVGLYPAANYQRRLQTLAAERGFFFVDPLPRMTATKGNKDHLYIPYDRNHPTASGHRLIAEAIADDPTMIGLVSGKAAEIVQ